MLSKGRQSIAFFIHPDDDVIIKCLDGSGKYEEISSIDYLNMRFAVTYWSCSIFKRRCAYQIYPYDYDCEHILYVKKHYQDLCKTIHLQVFKSCHHESRSGYIKMVVPSLTLTQSPIYMYVIIYDSYILWY